MVLVQDKIELLELAALLRIQATEVDQVIRVLIIQGQLALEEIEVDLVHLEQKLARALAPLVQLVVAQAAMALEAAAAVLAVAELMEQVAVLAQQDHRAAEPALHQVVPIWAKAKAIIPVQ